MAFHKAIPEQWQILSLSIFVGVDNKRKPRTQRISECHMSTDEESILKGDCEGEKCM